MQDLKTSLPLGGLGGQNPDMPGEIDDEAMVELAIALSLQEQGEGVDLANLQQGLQQLANLGPGLQGFPALQGLAGMLGGAVGGLPAEEVAPEPDLAPQQEAAGNYSDATASAPGNDFEKYSISCTHVRIILFKDGVRLHNLLTLVDAFSFWVLSCQKT